MSEDFIEDGEAPDDGTSGVLLPVSLQAMRSWLRLNADAAEDAHLTLLIGAATGLCEAFIGQWLMIRQGQWHGRILAGGRGLYLPVKPIVAVDQLALMENGGETPLDWEGYSVAIDRDGEASVRLVRGFGVRQIAITYRAGMAANEAALPEALRHGLIRMVQHLYETRDRPAGEVMPPAAVVALWQPWRRMTLGGRIEAGGGRTGAGPC